MKKLLASTFLVFCCWYHSVMATELTEALRNDKPLSEIQALIKKGANVNQPDEKLGLYPLMLVKDNAIFFELVKAGADIKAKTEYFSVFHNACMEGTLEMVQYLVKSGADVNEISGDKRMKLPPLMYAVHNKDSKVVEFLIESGADVKAKTEESSVFHEACVWGTLEMVQYLVKSGADVNEIAGDKRMKRTPLMCAVHNKDSKVVEFLIESGADVKKEMSDSIIKTALEQAVSGNAKPEIIDLLIKNGADIHKKETYSYISFYERIVRSSSYPEVIEIFQKAGLELKKEDLNFLFLKAIENRNSLEIAKYLLQRGADPNIQPVVFEGRPVKEDYPIIVAVKGNRPDALKFLLEQKVNVNVKDEDGKTPLQLLQENAYLIKDPDYNQYVMALGGTALSDTEMKKTQNSIKLLSDVSDREITLADVQKLIQEGVDVNFTDQYGNTPLSESVDIIDEDTYNGYKTKGIFADAPDYNVYLKKRLDIIDLLLNNGADINAKNKHGENLLFIAVRSNQPQLVGHLLKKGIDVNAADQYGNTPLSESVDIIDEDTYNGYKTKGIFADDSDYNAYLKKRFDIIDLLLNNGADINAKNKHGENLLFIAVRSNQPQLVEHFEHLLKKGIDVNAADQYGNTPLSESVDIIDEDTYNGYKTKGIFADAPDYNVYLKKRLDIIDLLLNNGADINAKNEHGENLLFIAVRSNQPQLVEHLLKKGIDVNAANNIGEMPFMEVSSGILKAASEDKAYLKKQLDMIDVLLNNGADINTKNKHGENLLFIAVRSNQPQLVEHLLKKGIDVNAANPVGGTPFMEASARRNADIIKILLKYGADETTF